MSEETQTFYVVTEEGDSMKVDASTPADAATAAVAEWGFEADPGYVFKVFAAADAMECKFALVVVPA